MMSDSSLEKILIIDDNSDYRKLIKTFISKLLPNVEVIEYDPVFKGIPDEHFNWSEIDVLLLDYHLSIVGTTGLDILHKHHKKTEFPATIMLTGEGTEEIAIRALKSGIYEYQPKQSLTKDKLKQSIIHAWEEKVSYRKKQQEITQHHKSFSKEVFYENLEKAFNHEPKRALVVIKPDNIKALEQQIGVIGRDNLVKHIAKNSFEVFKVGACNPNITRISDDAIAIQIDYPVNLKTLEFNMQGLCKHLTKCIFKFAEEKYKYTVSIGVLDLSLFNKKAEQLINIAAAAAKRTSIDAGNTYYIWQKEDVFPKLIVPIQTPQVIEEPIATTHDAKEEKIKLEAELKEIATAKAKAEVAIKTEQETKEKLEAELKLAAEAKLKAEAEVKAKAEAEAAIKTEQEAKAKLEAKLKAAAEEKDKLESKLKAAAEEKDKAEAEAKLRIEEEAKEKLEAELKAVAEEKAKTEAETKLHAEKEAKEKLEAELKAAAEEKVKTEAETKLRIEAAKEKFEAELKSAAEEKAKTEAEAKLHAEKEAKEKLEAELKAAAEEKVKTEAEAKLHIEAAKEKFEAELKSAAEEKAKTEAEAKLHAEKEAKEKLKAELKAAAEEKIKIETEIRAEKEVKQRIEAELKAEAESKAKAEAEAELAAAQKAKEKLEAELKAVTEARARAEAEIHAAKEAKEKLEAELKSVSERKIATATVEPQKNDPKPDSKTVENEIETENSDDNKQKTGTAEKQTITADDNDLSISLDEATEALVKKYIDEKKIIQTYQAVVAMSDTNENDTKEIYKTGLQSIIEDEQLNNLLKDPSIFSTSLQQTINEWVLRQVFLRITENGTQNCKHLFLLTVTEAWFSDITLFNWLQKILSQTKKYSPGKSIILNVPFDLFIKHQKRAEPLVNALQKTHSFRIALSGIESLNDLPKICASVASPFLILDIEEIKQLNAMLAPQSENNESDEEEEKKNLLQHLKENGIRIITSGIEDSTILMDAITAGTDYAIGTFVGETQDNLIDSGTVESFELT